MILSARPAGRAVENGAVGCGSVDAAGVEYGAAGAACGVTTAGCCCGAVWTGTDTGVAGAGAVVGEGAVIGIETGCGAALTGAVWSGRGATLGAGRATAEGAFDPKAFCTPSVIGASPSTSWTVRTTSSIPTWLFTK